MKSMVLYKENSLPLCLAEDESIDKLTLL